MRQTDHEALVTLTRTAVSILNGWDIAPAAQAVLLGLPENTKPRAMKKYQSGQPLPHEAEVLDRIECLMNMHRALEVAFPHNASMANYWVTTRNQMLNNQTPLDVMLEDGLAGMQRILGLLDNSGDWW